MQVTDYYAGTGPNPYDNVDPLFSFVGTAGDLVTLAQAKRINPEDSFGNRIQVIKSNASELSFPMGSLVQIIIVAKNDMLAWATSNVSNPDFTQMDSMTLFKSLFRTVAYYLNRDTTATELSTLPVSIVAPNLLLEIENQRLNWGDSEVDLGGTFSRQILRAVIDFDGELEARFLLGDLSDTTTTADLAALAAAWDSVIVGLA